MRHVYLESLLRALSGRLPEGSRRAITDTVRAQLVAEHDTLLHAVVLSAVEAAEVEAAVEAAPDAALVARLRAMGQEMARDHLDRLWHDAFPSATARAAQDDEPDPRLVAPIVRVIQAEGRASYARLAQEGLAADPAALRRTLRLLVRRGDLRQHGVTRGTYYTIREDDEAAPDGQ